MRVIFSLLTGLIMLTAAAPTLANDVGRPAPALLSETWLNTKPLQLASLKGKVVMVEFWTYGCHNCRNVEPYIKQWHKQFAPQGLVVIGVHSPEFDSERDIENVKRYVREHEITYPVAIDNDFATWKNYNNRYWPALYLIDKKGVIRYVHVGEGDYAQTEKTIQSLLHEG